MSNRGSRRILSGVAALCVLLSAYWAWRVYGEVPAPDASSPPVIGPAEIEESSGLAVSRAEVPRASKDSAGGSRAEGVGSPGSRYGLVEGQVLDLSGAPVPGVELWRAVERDSIDTATRTDGDGRFKIKASLGQVDICDPRYVRVARSSSLVGGQLIFLVVLAVTVDGYVADNHGNVVGDAEIRYGIEPSLIYAATPYQESLVLSPPQVATGSQEGGFVIRDAPAGARMAFTAGGYAPEAIMVPGEGARGITVVLRDLPLGDGRVYGSVMSSSQECVAGASVGFGMAVVKTNSRGVFSVLRGDLLGQAEPISFWVMAPGYIPKHASADIDDSGNIGTIVIDKGKLSLVGRVEDQDGRPVIGARVRIVDPSEFGYVPTRMGYVTASYVEDDPGRPATRCDEHGCFSIDGVSDRPYRVVAVCPETLASNSISGASAGDDGLVIVVDKGIVGELSGRVVDMRGRPVSGVRVVLSRRIEQGHSKRGLGFIDGPATDTDDLGVFRYQGVGSGALHLRVAKGVMPTSIEVDGSQREDLHVEVNRECLLRIRPRVAATIRALDRSGAECDIVVPGGNGYSLTRKLRVSLEVTIAVGDSVVCLRVTDGRGRDERIEVPASAIGETLTIDV